MASSRAAPRTVGTSEAMSILAPNPTGPTPQNPPGAEIGAVTQQVGGVSGWGSFVDELEYVPDLSWPQSVITYHRMRSDSQNEALHLGTVQPVREYRWSIDPNGAPAALAEQMAADFGLPIKGHEDEPLDMPPADFTWDTFLDDALLALLYGHFYFEIVGEMQGSEWHLVKCSPRHPKTIQLFQTDNVGDLLAIRQNIGGAGGTWTRLPPPIPAGKLIPFVWRPEAGSHIGRSMLRSMYREFMVKDRTIRVAAINLERGGGVPVIEAAQGSSDDQIRDLATLARQFKVAEGGGGAIPFGSKLTLVGGAVPEAVSLLEYCDQAMARVWANMLIQLGTTSNGSGSRALGGEFALYAARAQRSTAKWIVGQFNRFLRAYTIWNDDSLTKAPVLSFEQDKPDNMSTTEMVALIEAKALTVDPELETWLRSEHGLPEYTPPNDPDLGDLSPQEVALIQSSRNPPALPHGTPPGANPVPAPPAAPAPQDPNIQYPTNAAAPSLTAPTLALPDRPLRRQPNANEIRAQVNYRQMDATHSSVAGALVQAFGQGVIPGQIAALAAQITTTKTGNPRKVLTKAAMASLQAPLDGSDIVSAHLLDAAKAGAQAAVAELAAQGGDATIPSDAELAAPLGDQSNAIVAMAANSLSLSAQRKAAQMVGGGRSPADVAGDVRAYLGGLSNQWTAAQLRGSVTFAQNVGRAAAFATADQSVMRYYSSEIMDVNTCDECASVDGTEYDNLGDAEQDYSSGGYVDCAGGPNCRGTLIAVYGEQDPTSSLSSVGAVNA
jgi:hypothetical protein